MFEKEKARFKAMETGKPKTKMSKKSSTFQEAVVELGVYLKAVILFQSIFRSHKARKDLCLKRNTIRCKFVLNKCVQVVLHEHRENGIVHRVLTLRNYGSRQEIILNDTEDKEKKDSDSSSSSSSDSDKEKKQKEKVLLVRPTHRTQTYDAVLPKGTDTDRLAACFDLKMDISKTITEIRIDPAKARKQPPRALKFVEFGDKKEEKLTKARFIFLITKLQAHVRGFLKRNAIYNGNKIVCCYLQPQKSAQG